MNTTINLAHFRHWSTVAGFLAIACLLSSTAQAQRPSIAALQTQITFQQAEINAQQVQINSGTIPNVSSYVTMDVSNPSRPTLRLTAANFQVINGTNGTTNPVNGLGNVIIGYDEASVLANLPAVCSLGLYADSTTCTNAGGTWAVEHKEGSHNLVIGPYHRYSGNGGLIGGSSNTVNGNYASITGGINNTASGGYASVSAGRFNLASGVAASVSGGSNNTASQGWASVSGGSSNTASASAASVVGGYFNTASGLNASVSGGESNQATTQGASVSGGIGNHASALYTSVSGGQNNTASGVFSSISGGSGQTATNQADWVGGALHSP